MGRTGKDGGGGGDLVTIPEIPYMGAESACIIASGLVRSPTFPFLSCFSDLVLRLLHPL